MNRMATTKHNRRTLEGHNRRALAFRGGAYVANLMSELSRVGISQRIKQARLEAGLKQHEIADVLHVHRNTIQNWESQTNPITPWDRLGEIGDVLGVSRDWLIHGDHRGVDPQDATALRLGDAIRALQEGQDHLAEALMTTQENVLAKLAELVAALSHLEGSLSIRPERQQARGTVAPDSASIRPQ